MASQVNHFKEFATVAEYEAYIQPDDYAKPLVALVEATGTVMFPQGGGGGDCGNPILNSVDVEDFTGTSFDVSRNYITDAVIPDGVTSIVTQSFAYFTGLTSVTFPSTLTSIQANAFNGCTSLASIDLSGTAVTYINNYVFQDCTSLISADIPSSIMRISGSTFLRCSSLESLTVRATTPPELGYNALANTSANLVIYVPSESVETYKTASGWSAYASQIQAIP